MVLILNVKIPVGPIWNTGGTKTVISIPVSVLGPQRAGTEMGGDQVDTAYRVLCTSIKYKLERDERYLPYIELGRWLCSHFQLETPLNFHKTITQKLYNLEK